MNALRILLALALIAPVLRAQAPEPPKKEVSEKTSAGFAKLQTMVAAKDLAGALALVAELLAPAAPESYERYLLSQVQAQLLLNQNKLIAAIAPLEAAHELALRHPHFSDATSELERLQLLAQLHYQAGAEQKTPAVQRASFEKALSYIDSWLARSPKPTADARLLAASLLYNLATLESGKAEPARLRQAIAHVREALLLAVKPADQTRLLLVACHLQLDEKAAATEQLELLAARDPANATTWSQLLALYHALAEDAKNPDEVRAWNLRALFVLERAQARGLLSSPKEHYTAVAILFNLGQFARAAERLEAGLADGSLENVTRNWELLASAYQQTHQDAKALDAMGRAVKAFPDDGALEFTLAQTLYATGDVAAAYERGRSALAKPGLDKPGQAKLYLAFLAYELQRYDEAAKWVAAARDAGGVPDSSIEPLDRAIADALKNRHAAAQAAG